MGLSKIPAGNFLNWRVRQFGFPKSTPTSFSRSPRSPQSRQIGDGDGEHKEQAAQAQGEDHARVAEGGSFFVAERERGGGGLEVDPFALDDEKTPRLSS